MNNILYKYKRVNYFTLCLSEFLKHLTWRCHVVCGATFDSIRVLSLMSRVIQMFSTVHTCTSHEECFMCTVLKRWTLDKQSRHLLPHEPHELCCDVLDSLHETTNEQTQITNISHSKSFCKNTIIPTLSLLHNRGKCLVFNVQGLMGMFVLMSTLKQDKQSYYGFDFEF